MCGVHGVLLKPLTSSPGAPETPYLCLMTSRAAAAKGSFDRLLRVYVIRKDGKVSPPPPTYISPPPTYSTPRTPDLCMHACACTNKFAHTAHVALSSSP